MNKQVMKIAIIVTDESLEYLNKKEFYSLYDTFVRRYNTISNNDDNVEIITERYSAVSKEWPSEPLSFDGYIITGSVSSAYDQDEWILLLKQRIVELDNNEIKMCGICFGHQIIAEALGGKVEKNPKGWELGQVLFKFEDEAKKVLNSFFKNNSNNKQINNDSANSSRSNSPILINDGATEITTTSTTTTQQQEKDSISIYQIHQDHVSILPKDMISIGSTKYSIQGMLKESKKSKPGSYHIISFQGHPEFNYEFIHLLISDLHSVSDEIKKESLSTLQQTSCQPWLSNLVYNFFKNQ